MSGLVLELRPGESMIINGALVRFRTRSRIELVAKARFMFGKQIMAPDQADTPARRIYFALQSAYIGDEAERRRGLDAAHELIVAFKAATTSALAREILDRAEAAAGEDNCYLALKLARRIINHEDTVLGRPPPAGRDAGRDVSPCESLPASTRDSNPAPARGPFVSAATRTPERIGETHV